MGGEGVSEELPEYLSDALEMSGLPIMEIEPPSRQVIQTEQGEFRTATTTGWIKFGIAFRNVMHKLKGAKLAVFMSICLHVNDKGESWPEIRTIATETGYDKDTVCNAVNELREIPGLMAVVARAGRSNMYYPAYAVYGKHNTNPPVKPPRGKTTPGENLGVPPGKIRTEVEPISRINIISDDKETSSLESKNTNPEIHPAVKFYFDTFRRKRWGNIEQERLFLSTLEEVGPAALMDAIRWAAQNNIPRLPAICKAARKFKGSTGVVTTNPDGSMYV